MKLLNIAQDGLLQANLGEYRSNIMSICGCRTQ